MFQTNIIWYLWSVHLKRSASSSSDRLHVAADSARPLLPQPVVSAASRTLFAPFFAARFGTPLHTAPARQATVASDRHRQRSDSGDDHPADHEEPQAPRQVLVCEEPEKESVPSQAPLALQLLEQGQVTAAEGLIFANHMERGTQLEEECT